MAELNQQAFHENPSYSLAVLICSYPDKYSPGNDSIILELQMIYEGQEYVMKHDNRVFNRVCNVVCHEIVQQSLKLLGIEVKRFHHGARRDMTFGWFYHEIGLLSGRRACQYSLTWLIRGNRLHNFIRSKSFRFVA